MENKITKILAKEIRDSHGSPTIEVTVWVGGNSDSFSVPSGASTGTHEAHELRDKDGRGVKNAIDKVNSVIAPILLGQNVLNQKEIDRIMIELDGTPNKDNLGGNSMVGVSIACTKVAAKVSNQETYEYLRTLSDIKPSREVPYLFMNLIEGGKHSLQSPSDSLGTSDKSLAFQEYHVVPRVDNAREALDIGVAIQNTLKEIIMEDSGEKSTILGDEGGFAPKINDVRKPLIYLTEALKKNNLQDKVYLTLDVAASTFFQNNLYKIGGQKISKEDLMSMYDSLITEFNLFSIEDPFDQEDFDSFRELKDKNKDLLVVGDDLTVSNQMLLKKAIDKESINAMIIKPNQIGTLSETLQTMKLARDNKIELIISHRGEETNDDFIADLAYAFGCFGLKAGFPSKPERMVKYQRLIKISDIK